MCAIIPRPWFSDPFNGLSCRVRGSRAETRQAWRTGSWRSWELTQWRQLGMAEDSHGLITNLPTTWGAQTLLWRPCMRYPSQAVTPSPPAFCPLPGNSAASVSWRAASQRCPETASSRQPPHQAEAPTPPRRRDPGLGTMCQVRKEGGTGDTRGPQGAWERSRGC